MFICDFLEAVRGDGFPELGGEDVDRLWGRVFPSSAWRFLNKLQCFKLAIQEREQECSHDYITTTKKIIYTDLYIFFKLRLCSMSCPLRLNQNQESSIYVKVVLCTCRNISFFHPHNIDKKGPFSFFFKSHSLFMFPIHGQLFSFKNVLLWIPFLSIISPPFFQILGWEHCMGNPPPPLKEYPWGCTCVTIL